MLAAMVKILIRWCLLAAVLLLIATPIVRVFLCVVGFFSQRDRLYVAVSLMVLCVLLYSVIFGH